jgi:hypothetical protein
MAPRNLQETLAELEGTLEEERQALRTLRTAAIDEAAARKTVLERCLREYASSHGPLGGAERNALERVRVAAKRNMVLLVHARSCVRGALAAVTGSLSGAGYPMANTPRVAPLRFDVRR